MRNSSWLLVPALVLAACGGGKAPPKEPEPIIEDKPKIKPPPPPPPVCVRAGDPMSLVGMVEADDTAVKYCVSDGAESNLCYAVDLDSKKYSELAEAPKGSSAVLDPDPARVETTNKEVKVCVGETCKSFKPKVPKSDNQIDAVINSTGTYAAILLGNAEKGKGTVDVYNVAKGKKPVTIKYAKGDFKCGEARMLGDTVFVSASVCAGPAARGYLFNVTKGKKIADVGGKEFGTYGTVPVQLTETTWAFLEETGSSVAIQDVVTGKVTATIDLMGAFMPADDGSLTAPPGDELNDGGDDEMPAPPPLGNPGESAMVRGGEGKLVVVTGGPHPGSVVVIDVAGAAIAGAIDALVCTPDPAAATDEAPADEEDVAEDADEGGE